MKGRGKEDAESAANVKNLSIMAMIGEVVMAVPWNLAAS